jgi:type II secretory pathway component PulJ
MRKKLLKILKDKRGATLMELVVGMIISVIILGAASAVMVPMMQTFARTNNLAETNKLLDTLSGYVIADINRASSTSIEAGNLRIVTNVETFEYYINNDILWRRAAQAFDVAAPTWIRQSAVLERDFYRNKTLQVGYLDPDENPLPDGEVTGAFFIRLTITDNRDGLMGERDYAVNPLR